jgi:hypothetical protein
MIGLVCVLIMGDVKNTKPGLMACLCFDCDYMNRKRDEGIGQNGFEAQESRPENHPCFPFWDIKLCFTLRPETSPL